MSRRNACNKKPAAFLTQARWNRYQIMDGNCFQQVSYGWLFPISKNMQLSHTSLNIEYQTIINRLALCGQKIFWTHIRESNLEINHQTNQLRPPFNVHRGLENRPCTCRLEWQNTSEYDNCHRLSLQPYVYSNHWSQEPLLSCYCHLANEGWADVVATTGLTSVPSACLSTVLPISHFSAHNSCSDALKISSQESFL